MRCRKLTIFFLNLLVISLTSSLSSQAQQQPLAEEEKKAVSAPLVLSRTPPALFTEKLAPLLTPLQTVMERRGDYPTPDRDGVLLLDESLVHTDAEGRRILVYHYIEEALTESGTQALAEATFGFRTEDQRIHLVQARTILPGGKELAVEDRAIIMESPQTDAGDSLYGDRGQMRLIFSGVRPGAVREVIVAIEEMAPRIPGHFSSLETLGAYWPTRMSRKIIHMPPSVAGRLRETTLGTVTQRAVKNSLPDGWDTWIYERERVPPMRSEGGRPPQSQKGPAIFLTTLPDWETFGDWYRGLLEERSRLTPQLRKLARQWTKDAKTDVAKVEAILTHVARDVRYTGLEFGLGALQPRAPGQVWQTSYGDCKDKSNLAALLLRSVGVEAWLTLIQTEHAGRIERRSPDTRHFDHAILAVKTGEGWQFSDPTIRYGKPGMLAPSSSDREVLIMKKDGIEWSRTPATKGGTIHYHVDAARDEQGTLEGWLECREDGYYGASGRAYYERLSRNELKRDLQQTLGALMPGARLIDVEAGKDDDSLMWKVFFSQPGQTSGNDERVPLRFPAGGPVLLSVGNDETRETARFLWPITWRVTGSIRLPEGWRAADIPAPYDLHTEAYEVEARWVIKDSTCQPFYEGRVIRNLMEPEVHTTVWRGMQSLSGWLQRPLWITRSDSPAPAAATPAAAVSLGKFPLMPTGEGQLALVDERYPAGGDASLRRAALRKTLEYFPNDAVTVFTAHTRLAVADWNEDKNEEAEKALRQLLIKPAAKVDAETVAWARYVLGMVLHENKKYAEAAMELESLTAQTSLSTYRRSWSHFQLALALREQKENEKALVELRAGLALHVQDSSAPLLGLTAVILHELGRPQELEGDTRSVIETHAADAAPALTRLANQATFWTTDGHLDWAQSLLNLLDQSGFSSTDAAYNEALKKARATVASKAITGTLQKELQEYLEKHPDLHALTAPADGWPETPEAAKRGYEAADNVADTDTGHRLALHLLTAFPPDAEFSLYLWHAASHLDHYEREKKIAKPSPLLNYLVELADRLPKTDDTHFEVRFLSGRILEYRGQDWQAAADIYAALLADEAMPESFRSSATKRLADALQNLGEWEKTASALAGLVELKTYSTTGDGLARAAQIYLELGDAKEALRLLKVVESNRKYLVEKSSMAETLTEWLDIAKQEKTALKRWQLKPKWWAQWEKLRTGLGIEEIPVEPLIEDVSQAGAAFQQAFDARDKLKSGLLFSQLVHSARWLPARAMDLAWMSIYRMPNLHPEMRQPLKEFTLAVMTETLPVNERQVRLRHMYMTICQIDTDALEAARNQVHEYFKTYPQDEDTISFVMSRLWATLAADMPDEQAAASARLEKDLTSRELRDDRVMTISLLATLLQAQERGSEVKPLLERELKHPAITANETETAKLQNLLTSFGAEEEFNQAVQRWLARHAPPWYEHVSPKSLDEEGLEDLVSAVENANEERHALEAQKLRFLGAAHGSQPPEERAVWWAQAFSNHLREQALTSAQFTRAVLDVLEDEQTPALIKDSSLRIAAIVCADLHAHEEYKLFRNKLPASLISEFTHGFLECTDALFALDLNSAPAVQEAIAVQARKKDAQLLAYFANIVLMRSIQHGRMEAAQAVAEALAKVPKGTGSEASSLQSLRLGFAQILTGTKRLLPVHSALSEAVLKHAGTLRQDMAAEVPGIFGPVEYDRLGSAAYRHWLLQALESGVYERTSLRIWFACTEACAEYSPPKTLDLRKDLAAAAIAAAGDDETRAQVATFAASCFDADNAAERKILAALLKPWRDAVKMPKVYAEIRSLEAHFAVRNGQPLNIKGVIAQVKAPGMEQRLRAMHLHRVLNKGDEASINQALDDLGVDAMLESGNLINVIPALKKCGREDELSLAQEAAEAVLHENILSSWTGKDMHAVKIALKLAEILDRSDLLPEIWLKFASEAHPESQNRLVIEMQTALLKKDWPAALKAGEEVVKMYPTYYSNYWGKAKALWELGRKAEAEKSLRIFVKYCHDEHTHNEAEKMLKELAP